MTPTETSFVAKIKSRKVLRTLAIYASTSLTVLGGVNFFVKEYGFPQQVLDVLLALLVCGLPASLINSWLHGGEQRRRLQVIEMVSYPLLLTFAVFLSVSILKTSKLPRIQADARSIAVLPFENLSDSKEDDYFSDGVTDDIITHLSKISALKVISRMSVMKYKATRLNVREIGKALNVAVLLVGSVRRDRDRVRIVSQLIDPKSDSNLWAETFDREITDIFTIQSEVAQKIAAELKAKLSPEEKKRIEKKTTDNLDAYAYYTRGREYYYKYTKEDNEKAVEFFQKAVELDPNYALAFAGLGDAYAMRTASFGYPPEWLDAAVAASKQALSLDPNLAEGYKSLGLAQETAGETKQGLNSYYKAVELNPNYAPVIGNIAAISYQEGKYDEALKWAIRAATLQPGIARRYSLVALQYYYLEYDGPASAWFRKALEFQPDFAFPQIVMSYIDLLAGRIPSARGRITKVLVAAPDDANVLDAAGDVELLARNYRDARKHFQKLIDKRTSVGHWGNKLAFALLKLGENDKAVKIIEANLAAYHNKPEIDAAGSDVRYLIAQCYAMQKKAKETVLSLEKALANGVLDRWISVDPLLENVRPLRELKTLMAEREKRVEKMRKRVREQGLDR